jgi:hypothetical protein
MLKNEKYNHDNNFYNNMMKYMKIGFFFFYWLWPIYHTLSIVDIKLMARPLCIAHCVKQMVGFTKRTCWQRNTKLTKGKEFDLLCAC